MQSQTIILERSQLQYLKKIESPNHPSTVLAHTEELPLFYQKRIYDTIQGQIESLHSE